MKENKIYTSLGITVTTMEHHTSCVIDVAKLYHPVWPTTEKKSTGSGSHLGSVYQLLLKMGFLCRQGLLYDPSWGAFLKVGTQNKNKMADWFVSRVLPKSTLWRRAYWFSTYEVSCKKTHSHLQMKRWGELTTIISSSREVAGGWSGWSADHPKFQPISTLWHHMMIWWWSSSWCHR